MAGYSYFNYDQMTLLEIEVHIDELDLLQKAGDEYAWEAIETELEPKFKEAAMNFRDQKHSFVRLVRMNWMRIVKIRSQQTQAQIGTSKGSTSVIMPIRSVFPSWQRAVLPRLREDRLYGLCGIEWETIRTRFS